MSASLPSYLSPDFRNRTTVLNLAEQIKRRASRRWHIMEVCGGQTHAIIKYGLDRLIEPAVELVHGPGCPVCVTSREIIDHAVALARREEVIFCTFGDMIRVPGKGDSLQQAKAHGADVRVVYSPWDCLAIAAAHPHKEVVFFAIGFETTAPGNALTIWEARRRNLRNFSALVSHVLVPEALEAVLSDQQCQIHGFLAAGHVATVTGYEAYHAIAERYQTPIVIAGFEPVDLLGAIWHCVNQLESGEHRVENLYERLVRPSGNAAAQTIVDQVFERDNQIWRGLGTIPGSGMRLRADFADWDARIKFGLPPIEEDHDALCLSGLVMKGVIKPPQCPSFGKACQPNTPLGAPMVSEEGACSAYFRYRAAKGDERTHAPQ